MEAKAVDLLNCSTDNIMKVGLPCIVTFQSPVTTQSQESTNSDRLYIKYVHTTLFRMMMSFCKNYSVHCRHVYLCFGLF